MVVYHTLLSGLTKHASQKDPLPWRLQEAIPSSGQAEVT